MLIQSSPWAPLLSLPSCKHSRSWTRLATSSPGDSNLPSCSFAGSLARRVLLGVFLAPVMQPCSFSLPICLFCWGAQGSRKGWLHPTAGIVVHQNLVEKKILVQPKHF